MNFPADRVDIQKAGYVQIFLEMPCITKLSSEPKMLLCLKAATTKFLFPSKFLHRHWTRAWLDLYVDLLTSERKRSDYFFSWFNLAINGKFRPDL